MKTIPTMKTIKGEGYVSLKDLKKHFIEEAETMRNVQKDYEKDLNDVIKYIELGIIPQLEKIPILQKERRYKIKNKKEQENE